MTITWTRFWYTGFLVFMICVVLLAAGGIALSTGESATGGATLAPPAFVDDEEARAWATFAAGSLAANARVERAVERADQLFAAWRARRAALREFGPLMAAHRAGVAPSYARDPK